LKSQPSQRNALIQARAKTQKAPSVGGGPIPGPALQPGPKQWYSPNHAGLRLSSLAGYADESNAALGSRLPYNRITVNDHNFVGGNGPNDLRATSGPGHINFPDPENKGGYYFEQPQYAALTMAHEMAHNADRQQNAPVLAHGPTFRPLEKAAVMAAGEIPQYNPGTDYKGQNEYADSYAAIPGGYKQHFYVGQNVQDPTRGKIRVDPQQLAKALAQQQQVYKQPTKQIANNNVRANLI
jgi:hypothetical protein